MAEVVHVIGEDNDLLVLLRKSSVLYFRSEKKLIDPVWNILLLKKHVMFFLLYMPLPVAIQHILFGIGRSSVI